jgi:hypothetical protein
MGKQMVYNEQVHTLLTQYFSVIVTLPFLPSPMHAGFPRPLPSAGLRANFPLVSK